MTYYPTEPPTWDAGHMNPTLTGRRIEFDTDQGHVVGTLVDVTQTIDGTVPYTELVVDSRVVNAAGILRGIGSARALITHRGRYLVDPRIPVVLEQHRPARLVP